MNRWEFTCSPVLAWCVSAVRGKASRSSSAATDSVATVDDIGDFSLQKTISDIEQRLDSARHDNNYYDDDDDDDDGDLMPAVANEMGIGQYLDNLM